jgi:hypothetical protein
MPNTAYTAFALDDEINRSGKALVVDAYSDDIVGIVRH